ncbi:MAG TPA: response regulator [Anaerolineales bacterium]|nr:response regulator [Anaerolineales bacterium]
MSTGNDYLLIVEDDPDILKLLDAALTFKGYRVIRAQNGEEGLKIIQDKHPAMVIADIMMPKMDGFGLIHRLRIRPETRDIPVVFITATYVTREDRSFALRLGATRFIQKPLDLEQFLGTITDLLKQGLPTLIQPLSDYEFYLEYRKRLEAKLEATNKQIARQKHLLQSDSDKDNPILLTSLQQDLAECKELEFLLGEINEQLKRYTPAE